MSGFYRLETQTAPDSPQADGGDEGARGLREAVGHDGSGAYCDAARTPQPRRQPMLVQQQRYQRCHRACGQWRVLEVVVNEIV